MTKNRLAEELYAVYDTIWTRQHTIREDDAAIIMRAITALRGASADEPTQTKHKISDPDGQWVAGLRAAAILLRATTPQLAYWVGLAADVIDREVRDRGLSASRAEQTRSGDDPG